MKHSFKIFSMIFVIIYELSTNLYAQNTFEAGNGSFLLNGKPFIIKAAEVHYPRIPRPYWDNRIKMCKSLGMNTICIYVFWNIHEQEEGVFNFDDNNDVAEFCRIAQKNGMYVIVRPGPYVCAEWEMGGLPWWLLKKKDIRLREEDPYFLERVKLFEQKVGEQLAPLTIQKGGPIIMVQVENEYGSYGENKSYVSKIRDIVKESGFNEVALFQCDWSSNFEKNGLDDMIWTMNFGTGANIEDQFRRLKQLRPESPLMCSEFWSGWFDKWGGKHETRPSLDMVQGIKDMLERNISFSLYMTHGGTSFGHWAGANSPGFSPDVTSYDYDAPINEYGHPTDKYYELRNLLQKYSPTELPSEPKTYPIISIPQIKFSEYAPLFENLPTPIQTERIQTMEEFNQGWGSIMYSTTLPEIKTQSILTIKEGHDYVQVFIDDKYIGSLDRRMGDKEILLPSCKKGSKLNLLVEAMGRINFGRAIKDFKGIVGDVNLTINIDGNDFTSNLKKWSTYLIPDTYDFYNKASFQPLIQSTIRDNKGQRIPGIYKATFKLDKTGDTFMNFESFGKGLVYVNGRGMGRIWEIGPQQTLYIPGCWLKKGTNEILVFDVVGPKDAITEGLTKPIIDKLQEFEPPIHRKEGEQLDLSEETPVIAGQFAQGNGWQEIKFSNPISGRYVCIEALSSFDDKEYTCISELYLLDESGERISREPWKIRYADSEDITTGNKAGDKVYDLQESTYWSTVKGIPFPHTIIIDLGKTQSLTALQYLPRMESHVPGAIKDYKIYIKQTDFKY